MAISGATAWGLREGMSHWVPGAGKLHAVLDLAVVGVAFVTLYLGLARVLHVTEVTDVMRLVTRRLHRRK